MNKTIYFNDDEGAWIDKQGPGYVRKLVQADKAAKSTGVYVDKSVDPAAGDHYTKDSIGSAKKRAANLAVKFTKKIDPNTFCEKHGVMKVAGKCPECGK